MAEALKKRSEMDPQFQWDLRDLIPTEKALEELFSELESGIGRYEGFKGRLGEDAAVLKEYLDHDVAMDLKFSRLLAYAIQKRDEDTSQSASQALLSRAQLLLSRAMEASSFAEPELLGIPEPVMKGFLEDGALSGYRLYLERILAGRSICWAKGRNGSWRALARRRRLLLRSLPCSIMRMSASRQSVGETERRSL